MIIYCVMSLWNFQLIFIFKFSVVLWAPVCILMHTMMCILNTFLLNMQADAQCIPPLTQLIFKHIHSPYKEEINYRLLYKSTLRVMLVSCLISVLGAEIRFLWKSRIQSYLLIQFFSPIYLLICRYLWNRNCIHITGRIMSNKRIRIFPCIKNFQKY